MTELQGLRERKKARTRASLREHALRLFRQQGYTATTVEQIAAAAEVSPSTFFRYFPTKEDVILQDDLDARILEAFERQPTTMSVIPAIRTAIREAMVSYTEQDMAMIRETTALTMTVPEIRARAIDEFARSIHSIAGSIAKRTGRTEDDLAVRTVAGVVIGVMMTITLPLWEAQSTDWSPLDALGEFEVALALLEPGLPLLPEPANCRYQIVTTIGPGLSETGSPRSWTRVNDPNREVRAMKYVILIMDGPERASMTEDQRQAYHKEIYAWYEKWGGTPQLPDGGQQLQTPDTAKTIRAGGVTDGPFIETKEAIGGYSVLDTGTLDEAVEIARTWPGIAEGWTTIEVRPTVAM